MANRLGTAKSEGALFIAAVVYAELLTYSNATELFVNQFLAETGMIVDFRLQESVWKEAGENRHLRVQDVCWPISLLALTRFSRPISL